MVEVVKSATFDLCFIAPPEVRAAHGASQDSMSGSRPRWAARTNRRGTRTRRPWTTMGTRSDGRAFHCERRCRVLLRELLPLGTATRHPPTRTTW
jgi:hypothetical protein